MIVAVVASVFLFACSARPEQAERAPASNLQARQAPMPDASHAPQAPHAPQPMGGVQVPGRVEPAAHGVATAQIGEALSEPQPPAPATTENTDPSEDATGEIAAEPAPRLYDASGHRVFSNKDLERYRRTKEEFGMHDNVVVVDVTKKPSSDADEKPGTMTMAEKSAEMETTRRRITTLLEQLDYEKKRVLPLENPFVPRPQITDQDKLSEAGMDNKQRLDRVKGRISEIDAELNTLQRRLAELSNAKTSDEPRQEQE